MRRLALALAPCLAARPAPCLGAWPPASLATCLAVGLATCLGCVRVEAGTEPEPLGYGPGPDARLANGYERDVNARPAPTPWTPPQQFEPRFDSRPRTGPTGPDGLTGPDGPTGPVPYSADILGVCEHLASLADVDADFATDRCLARYRIERVFRPLPDWKLLAACVTAAAAAAEVQACLDATPRAFPPTPAHPREAAVCMHIFATTIVEQLGPEPMLDAPQLAEFAPLLDDCVTSLVEDERDKRKPAAYLEMLDCIERAQTTAAAEACE